MKVTRRRFLSAAAAAGATARALGQAPAAPRVNRPAAVRPLVIASSNGHEFRNGGELTCVEKAFSMITSGSDVLDAVIAGVNIVELDPLDDSVGFGGLPNADGVVQLDSCCMHGPKKRAGGVAALEGVRTPSLVARAVADLTDHHLLVGTGAQTFARQMGFRIEDDLNTENSRRKWLHWKRRIDPSHFPDPKTRAEAGERARQAMIAEGLLDPLKVYGTINCNAINGKGEICGVTTTSGLAWKIPGRVGDSPILGAGLYVDGGAGAAGSTGRGEANLFNLSSAMIVENIRRGMHPKDSCLEACRRIKASTIDPRLLNESGNPKFDITFYALDAKGRYAGVAMYAGAKFAICTEKGGELLSCEPLLEGTRHG